jgi:hypothetical protein
VRQIVFKLQDIKTGHVESGRIKEGAPPCAPITIEDVRILKQAYEDEGFKILEFELVEVQ